MSNTMKSWLRKERSTISPPIDPDDVLDLPAEPKVKKETLYDLLLVFKPEVDISDKSWTALTGNQIAIYDSSIYIYEGDYRRGNDGVMWTFNRKDLAYMKQTKYQVEVNED